MWKEKKSSKDRENLKEYNEKLQYKIADLLKAGDLNKTKLIKI